jgi:hypothetical protein
MYYLDASKIYRKAQFNAALSSTLGFLGISTLKSARPKLPASITGKQSKYRGAWDDAGVALTLMSLGDLEKRLGDSIQRKTLP